MGGQEAAIVLKREALVVVERRQLENKVLGKRRQWGPEPKRKVWPLGGGRRGQGRQLLVMLQGALKGERAKAECS